MKRILLTLSSIALLASCGGNNQNESSNSTSLSSDTSFFSSQTSESSKASISSNSISSSNSESTVSIAFDVDALQLSGGLKLDTTESIHHLSLSVDNETGVLTFQNSNGDSLLQRFVDGNLDEIGFVSIEEEHVTAYRNGVYTLEYGMLSVEEIDDLYLITYSVISLSGNYLNRYFAFAKDNATLVSNFRYSASMDIHYGDQWIVSIENHGYAYVRNNDVRFGYKLYYGDQKQQEVLDDGIYELRKQGEESLFFYFNVDAFNRASIERGTYTCTNKDDLFLDGFGHYILGEKSGRYVYQNDGAFIYISDPDDESIRTLYDIDMEHMTYAIHEVSPETSPIALGSVYEGMNTYSTGGVSMILEIHINFSSFTENRVAEMQYSNRLPSQTWYQSKVNLEGGDYVYSEGMITFSSTTMATWSFEVSNDVKTLYLRDNPLGLSNADNSFKLTLQTASSDD